MVGVPLRAAIFLEIDALVIALMIVAFSYRSISVQAKANAGERVSAVQ